MIELLGICKTYNAGGSRVHALDSITLKINQGEFLAVIGHSGSGKSTLLNILGCLDIPDEGEFRLYGKELSHASPGERAKIRNREIGFIFQGCNLAPQLTALENVELPLLFRGVPSKNRRNIARDALESVGLGDRIKHKPNQLSGGQRQRVAVARAIAARPPLILADEPTGSLDRTAATECMNLLKDLNRSGHTVVLITHDKAAAAYSDRKIELSGGRIVNAQAM